MNTFCTAAAYMGLSSSFCDSASELSLLENHFIEHLSTYGISYGTQEEYKFRLGVYQALDAEYKSLNANPENTFTVGHNKFSTWTKQEFAKLLAYSGP